MCPDYTANSNGLQAPIFDPGILLRNAHLQTVLPSLIRSVRGVRYERERIDTPDGDFLDLDWSRRGHKRLAVVLHGLESSARQSYVRGMIQAFNRRGYDGLGFNLRGCSGIPNRLLASYHSGATGDIRMVLDRIARESEYRDVFLVGFSLGGNITLKLLGELGADAPSVIRGGAAVSTPCDLETSANLLDDPKNRYYQWRFLDRLKHKARIKSDFPDAGFSIKDIDRINTIREFDDLYTAPVHGFRDARDYWQRSSSRQFLHAIRVPTMLLNARDDPFLDSPSYPSTEEIRNSAVTTCYPSHGGHAGFFSLRNAQEYWHETLVASFADQA